MQDIENKPKRPPLHQEFTQKVVDALAKAPHRAGANTFQPGHGHGVQGRESFEPDPFW